MEKLKLKHDHTLTNILKVFIFSIFLMLPIFTWLPTAFYYGFNEQANAPTTEIEITETKILDFNQLFDYNNKSQCWSFYGGATGTVDNTGITVDGIGRNGVVLGSNYRTNFENDSVYYISFDYDTTVLFECQYANGAYSDRIDVGTGHYMKTANNLNGKFYYFDFFPSISGATGTTQISNIMVINLTQMYGSGNEPSADVFYQYFNGVYYDYVESRTEILVIPTGQYETYIDITRNTQQAWQDVWTQPLFNWTGNNNFEFTINAFTSVFGITPQSYITNYINYLLTLTAIYIVFDIIIMVFVKLTHIFGNE